MYEYWGSATMQQSIDVHAFWRSSPIEQEVIALTTKKTVRINSLLKHFPG